MITILKWIKKNKLVWYFNYRIKTIKAQIYFSINKGDYYIQFVFPVRNVLDYVSGEASFYLKETIKEYNKTKDWNKAMETGCMGYPIDFYGFEDYQTLNMETDGVEDVKMYLRELGLEIKGILKIENDFGVFDMYSCLLKIKDKEFRVFVLSDLEPKQNKR